MLISTKELITTLQKFSREPVTIQPTKKHAPEAKRNLGFPALTWDYDLNEPYCNGCMVCIKECPTQCMKAKLRKNRNWVEGESYRRTIVKSFDVNLERCIQCGICVDVCFFDAIVMTNEHEFSSYERNHNTANIDDLLNQGKTCQAETNWKPTGKVVKGAIKEFKSGKVQKGKAETGTEVTT